METARLFVALPCVQDVRRELALLCGKIAAANPEARTVQPGNLHMTLAFIGQTPVDLIDKIIGLLPKEVEPEKSMTIHSVGSFPGKKLVFADLSDDGYAASLARVVRDNLSQAGIPFDKQRFVPHITLARNVRNVPDIRFKPITLPVLPPVLYLSKRDRLSRLVYVPLNK